MRAPSALSLAANWSHSAPDAAASACSSRAQRSGSIQGLIRYVTAKCRGWPMRTWALDVRLVISAVPLALQSPVSCPSPCSFRRDWRGRRARPGMVEIAQDLLEAVEHPIEIVARNDEGRREANHGGVRLLGQHALRQQPFAGLARSRNARIELDARPQEIGRASCRERV